jgi:tetratricopeptide (TPR) repeat protein
LIHEGNLEEAQGCLKQLDSYEYSPEYRDWLAGVWNALGIAYGKKGEYDRAIEAFCKALELKPDLHEAWNNLGVVYLAISLEALRNEEMALRYYENALDCLRRVLPLRRDGIEQLLIEYFRALLKHKALGFAEKALKLLEAQGQDWAELMRPYRAALDYLKTKDKTILQRLFPEIRQIVEEMVALVEGQS